MASTMKKRAASRDQRYAAGKAMRDRVPREAHGEWRPAAGRHDPVELVVASSRGRIPELVPLRYGRMSVSPFAFYRGTALNMAADLSRTPVSGIRTQVCGDCHLMNFGGFASSDRRVVFDINDFDETLPGPWEWDLKRLVASFALAARSNGFPPSSERDSVLACARSYREHMREYAKRRALDVWYARIEIEAVMASLSDRDTVRRLRQRVSRTAAHSAPDSDFPRLAEGASGRYRIKDAPPLIYHHADINLESERDDIVGAVARYHDSLQEDRRALLERYAVVDFALKVVGIGSVGTFCGILLLMAGEDDPLFLQVKEARPSVLEKYLGRRANSQHGRRVVEGQRLMQSASDPFLGWSAGKRGRQFYVRQLRDMKMKPLVDQFNRSTLDDYAAICGWTLARAHARSGDGATIAGYLGKGDACDQALARFARAYADQAERDHSAFVAAIRKGRIEVRTEDA